MTCLTHIAFQCKSIAAQEAFYSRHFGFKRARTLRAGQPDEFILIKLGNVRLEFFTADPTLSSGQRGGEQAIGFRHLAFEVPRLEPCIEALRADGIEPDPIVDASKILSGLRIVFFRDPEGNIVELMEGYRDE